MRLIDADALKQVFYFGENDMSILGDAKLDMKVQSIIDNAPTVDTQTELIVAKSQSYERGFAEGYEEGFAKGKESPIEDLSDYSDKLWKLAYERGKAEARPQGEWLEVKEEVHYDYWTVCECSLCKHSWALGELSIENIKDDYKFCPNCGAKMTKEVENDLSI